MWRQSTWERLQSNHSKDDEKTWELNMFVSFQDLPHGLDLSLFSILCSLLSSSWEVLRAEAIAGMLPPRQVISFWKKCLNLLSAVSIPKRPCEKGSLSDQKKPWNPWSSKLMPIKAPLSCAKSWRTDFFLLGNTFLQSFLSLSASIFYAKNSVLFCFT